MLRPFKIDVLYIGLLPRVAWVNKYALVDLSLHAAIEFPSAVTRVVAEVSVNNVDESAPSNHIANPEIVSGIDGIISILHFQVKYPSTA